MMTFFLALGLIAILMAAMAIGVIVKNKPIVGSCGGLNQLGLGGECEICGGNTHKCEEQKQSSRRDVAALSYDASQTTGSKSA